MIEVWGDLLEITEMPDIFWTFKLLLHKDTMMPYAANQIILLPLFINICGIIDF